eukprot:4393318-Amphidinium_carterae.2
MSSPGDVHGQVDYTFVTQSREEGNRHADKSELQIQGDRLEQRHCGHGGAIASSWRALAAAGTIPRSRHTQGSASLKGSTGTQRGHKRAPGCQGDWTH